MRLTGRRKLLPYAAAFAATVALAACSSTSSSTAASPTSSSTGSAGVAKAQHMVAQLSTTTTQYPVPTASYIPLVQAIPGFVVTAQTMKVAMAKAGLKLQVCDGQGNPTSMAACVSQAEGAKAAGIIMDAIPYGMIQNALDGAKAKGIPIVVTDQIAPPGTTSTAQVAYVPGVIDQPSQIAWWTIADSKGKANLIIGEEADSPSSLAYVQTSLPIYKQYCSGYQCQEDLGNDGQAAGNTS